MQYDEYEIIGYNPILRDQVLDLLGNLWGGNRELNARYLEWKYRENPYADRPLIYIALYKGQAVGLRSYSGACWHTGAPDRSLPCLADSDGYILPEHRRRGLFSKISLYALNELAVAGYKWLFTFSGNQISSEALLKIGWGNGGELTTLHWQPRQDNRGGSGLRQIARQIPLLRIVYRGLNRILSRGRTTSGKGGSFDILDRNFAQQDNRQTVPITLERKPRPAHMAALVKRMTPGKRIQHMRDAQFFSWKYKNPLAEYRFLFLEGAGLPGYLVLHAPASSSENVATIVDWEAENNAIWVDLVTAVKNWGGFDTLTIWSATLSTEQKGSLTELGFSEKGAIETPEGKPFCPIVMLKPLGASALEADWSVEGVNLLDISNWDLRPIYSDAF